MGDILENYINKGKYALGSQKATWSQKSRVQSSSNWQEWFKQHVFVFKNYQDLPYVWSMPAKWRFEYFWIYLSSLDSKNDTKGVADETADQTVYQDCWKRIKDAHTTLDIHI